MKKKYPLDGITALKAGCDRFSITFGRGLIFVEDIYKRSVEKLGNDTNIEIRRNKNLTGYEMVVKAQLPLSVAKIYIGKRNSGDRPHKLEFAGSRMSDNDYMQLRRILIKVFGMEILGDIYEHGNITVAEFHVDLYGVNTGDLVPCNYAQNWMVIGKGGIINSIYWGNKLFKSYNKSKWFRSKGFKSQVQYSALSDFIHPTEAINRIERTVKKFKGTKKGVVFSPKLLVEEGYSPFKEVEFIDTRIFDGNPHLNLMALTLLRTVGPSTFMNLCRSVKPAPEVNTIDRLIGSATRTGFGEDVNKMIKKSIQKMEFLSPEFSVKRHKENTEKPILKYHHLGFMTRELLSLLNYDNDIYELSSPNDNTKKYLYKVFGTTDMSALAGKAVTEKQAHKLILLALDSDAANSQ